MIPLDISTKTTCLKTECGKKFNGSLAEIVGVHVAVSLLLIHNAVITAFHSTAVHTGLIIFVNDHGFIDVAIFHVTVSVNATTC